MLVKIIESPADGKMLAVTPEGGIIPFNKATANHPTLWKNTASKAYAEGYAFQLVDGKWSKVSEREFNKAEVKASAPVDVPEKQLELMQFIQASPNIRPIGMKMTDIKWKYLIRCAMRGKNIMMTGPAGCGKTMAAKSVVNALDRPDFYFNLGATQDPRATLIGNTHFNKDTGTVFSEALFVKAIQTPNSVILLDELSRAHPEAHNILMTVLDEGHGQE